MSYDLYFYKKKNSLLTEDQFSEYLNNNLNSTSESDTQWFVVQEDTEVYFSIEQNEPDLDEENIMYFESFNEFDFLHFTFNLNFLRPDFFGQYAFKFVDQMIQELDLYVLNLQNKIDLETPYKPQPNELYKNWSELNAENSANLFKKYKLDYYPLEKSNDFYDYNLHKEKLQEKLGDNYFVPKLYLFKKKSDGSIFTLSTWTEHIPNVFPPADCFLLIKKYKKLFRTVKEVGLISSKTLVENFGSLLENFEFKNCKIIHPENAAIAKNIFNSIKFEFILEEFAEKVEMDNLVNVKPKD